MKKSLPRLVLRKETLRTLSGLDLSLVIGGDSDAAQVYPETGDKQCPAPAVVMPGG
jgi:hypothetical protein